jgi:hypothetical protein
MPARQPTTREERFMENEDLVSVLSKVMAWIDATRPLIEAMVITHPAPHRLRDAWQQRLPLQVEEGMDTAPFEVSDYREKLLQNLGDISKWLDDLADRHTGGNPT